MSDAVRFEEGHEVEGEIAGSEGNNPPSEDDSVTTERTEQTEGETAPDTIRILIAPSSSGGHIIPALHIARAIKEREPHARVEFIGVGKPLEEKLIVGNGYTRHLISAAAVKGGGIRGLLNFIKTTPSAVRQIRQLFRSFKPDVVIGVGGYVSVLPIIVARMQGIPTWIHEAERHLGLANRVNALFADRISTAFAETEVRGRAKIECTGHPVRAELARVDTRTIRAAFPQRLLILGGSQGARGLDAVVPEIAPFLVAHGIEVVHQSRPESVDQVQQSYSSAGARAHVVPFIDDMAGAYEWADVIISRSGAASVAEIACVNRPAIFVPYPHQQGTHQTDNARTLVDRGKAMLVEENRPDFANRLRDALARITDPAMFRTMKSAPSEPRGLQAADAIARGVVGLAGRDGV